jgi:hypothetical protein
MATAPYVVDLGDAHAVVVPDWHSYHSLLGEYCGERKFDGSLARDRDLYILCHDAVRADEVLAVLMKHPFSVAQEIAIGRKPTYGPTAARLVEEGHAVACDSLGPDCDDERLKALHPAPCGPMIDFQWIAREKRYRMRCLSTGRNGETASQRIVLKDGPDWDQQIRKGYGRFARRTPPLASTFTCLPHAAAILSRLDWHAARRLARWRAEMETAGIDAHQEVAPFLVSSSSVDAPGDLLAVELKGVRGSYALWSRCDYHGGTTVVDRLLDLRAALPQTLVFGLVGQKASVIWGDPDLAGLTIRRIGKGNGVGFLLEGDAVPLPVPQPAPVDEDVAAADLHALEMPRGIMIEGVVLRLMADLPASARLHVYRSLTARDETRIDIAPWLPDPSKPVIVKRDHLIISHYSSLYYRPDEGIEL